MKKRNWIGLLICLLMAVVAVGGGIRLHRDRMEQVRSAFGEALQDELQKWGAMDVYSCSSGHAGYKKLPNDSIDIKKEPVKVTLKSDYGQKDYWIPYEKYSRNIERTHEVSLMHTCLLHQAPLNADSLNLFWKGRLAKSGLPGTTVVRIATMDWEEHESYAYSADTLYLSKADSLATSYIGCRSEVGVTGYFYAPWWSLLSWKYWGGLVVVAAACLLLFRIYVRWACRRSFVKEKSAAAEKPVIQEKIIPVIVGRESGSHIYQLEKGVYFEADFRLLKKGDAVVKLGASAARLLQGFLDAENHKLSNDEILQLLWPNGNGTQDKLYQSIKRLRDSLSEISICTIDGGQFFYQLKIPHSIEENPA